MLNLLLFQAVSQVYTQIATTDLNQIFLNLLKKLSIFYEYLYKRIFIKYYTLVFLFQKPYLQLLVSADFGAIFKLCLSLSSLLHVCKDRLNSIH